MNLQKLIEQVSENLDLHLLEEGRKEDARAMLPNLSDEEFQQLLDGDPTSTTAQNPYKYIKWMATQVKKGKDIEDVVDLIRSYNSVLNTLPANLKNIDSLNYDSLYAHLEPIIAPRIVQKKTEEIIQFVKKPDDGMYAIPNSINVALLRVVSINKSCEFSKKYQTGWCLGGALGKRYDKAAALTYFKTYIKSKVRLYFVETNTATEGPYAIIYEVPSSTILSMWSKADHQVEPQRILGNNLQEVIDLMDADANSTPPNFDDPTGCLEYFKYMINNKDVQGIDKALQFYDTNLDDMDFKSLIAGNLSSIKETIMNLELTPYSKSVFSQVKTASGLVDDLVPYIKRGYFTEETLQNLKKAMTEKFYEEAAAGDDRLSLGMKKESYNMIYNAFLYYLENVTPQKYKFVLSNLKSLPLGIKEYDEILKVFIELPLYKIFNKTRIADVSYTPPVERMMIEKEILNIDQDFLNVFIQEISISNNRQFRDYAARLTTSLFRLIPEFKPYTASHNIDGMDVGVTGTDFKVEKERNANIFSLFKTIANLKETSIGPSEVQILSKFLTAYSISMNLDGIDQKDFQETMSKAKELIKIKSRNNFDAFKERQKMLPIGTPSARIPNDRTKFKYLSHYESSGKTDFIFEAINHPDSRISDPNNIANLLFRDTRILESLAYDKNLMFQNLFIDHELQNKINIQISKYDRKNYLQNLLQRLSRSTPKLDTSLGGVDEFIDENIDVKNKPFFELTIYEDSYVGSYFENTLINNYSNLNIDTDSKYVFDGLLEKMAENLGEQDVNKENLAELVRRGGARKVNSLGFAQALREYTPEQQIEVITKINQLALENFVSFATLKTIQQFYLSRYSDRAGAADLPFDEKISNITFGDKTEYIFSFFNTHFSKYSKRFQDLKDGYETGKKKYGEITDEFYSQFSQEEKTQLLKEMYTYEMYRPYINLSGEQGSIDEQFKKFMNKFVIGNIDGFVKDCFFFYHKHTIITGLAYYRRFKIAMKYLEKDKPEYFTPFFKKRIEVLDMMYINEKNALLNNIKNSVSGRFLLNVLSFYDNFSIPADVAEFRLYPVVSNEVPVYPQEICDIFLRNEIIPEF